MRCVKCSKDMPPGAAFCASCGARVKAAPPAGEKRGAPWIAIGSIVAGLGILGASGYWGYASYAAKEEAAQKAAEAEKTATTLVSVKKPAPVSAEEAAERAEILAAQQALSKAILAEEAMAKAKAGAQ